MFTLTKRIENSIINNFENTRHNGYNFNEDIYYNMVMDIKACLIKNNIIILNESFMDNTDNEEPSCMYCFETLNKYIIVISHFKPHTSIAYNYVGVSNIEKYNKIYNELKIIPI